MSHTIFGYGSLILFESVVSRFDNTLPNIDPVYEQRPFLPEPEVLTSDLTTLLEKHDNITILPAKIHGFIRTYTLESPRGGAMLEAYYTGRPDDVLNGVVITGLTDEQYDQIQSTESMYDTYTIDPDEFDFYVDVPDNIELESCTLNLGGNTKYTNWNTQRIRNPTYHSRILAGIQQLETLYDTNLKTEFWRDFTNNTYEFPAYSLDLTQEELNNI